MISKGAALLFDYDGLLVDTESTEFRSWQKVFADHGAELTVREWLQAVGHVGNFDPRAALEKKIGRRPDWRKVDAERAAHNQQMVRLLPPLPGARRLLSGAREAGWRTAVVSNSVRDWVEPGLERLGLLEFVQVIVARGEAQRVKPHPDPYLRALSLLGADAGLSVAFEDSQPGVQSALAAGVTVVAVPNGLTKHQDLSAAHHVLNSLGEFPLPAARTA